MVFHFGCYCSNSSPFELVLSTVAVESIGNDNGRVSKGLVDVLLLVCESDNRFSFVFIFF